MASRDPNDLAPATREKWFRMEKILHAAGVHAFLTTTLRPPAEQQTLYGIGRFGNPGRRVTNAQAWESWHQPWIEGKALAFDLAFRPEGNPQGATWDGPWELVGAVGEFVGLRWGGRWRTPDRPHFEDSAGLSLAALQQEHGKQPGVFA